MRCIEEIVHGMGRVLLEDEMEHMKLDNIINSLGGGGGGSRYEGLGGGGVLDFGMVGSPRQTRIGP